MTDELRGQLVDVLNSGAIPLAASQAALVDAVEPLVRAVVAGELAIVADELEVQIENPEQPWAQGVQFAVDHLRERAGIIERGLS